MISLVRKTCLEVVRWDEASTRLIESHKIFNITNLQFVEPINCFKFQIALNFCKFKNISTMSIILHFKYQSRTQSLMWYLQQKADKYTGAHGGIPRSGFHTPF